MLLQALRSVGLATMEGPGDLIDFVPVHVPRRGSVLAALWAKREKFFKMDVCAVVTVDPVRFEAGLEELIRIIDENVTEEDVDAAWAKISGGTDARAAAIAEFFHSISGTGDIDFGLSLEIKPTSGRILVERLAVARGGNSINYSPLTYTKINSRGKPINFRLYMVPGGWCGGVGYDTFTSWDDPNFVDGSAGERLAYVFQNTIFGEFLREELEGESMIRSKRHFVFLQAAGGPLPVEVPEFYSNFLPGDEELIRCGVCGEMKPGAKFDSALKKKAGVYTVNHGGFSPRGPFGDGSGENLEICTDCQQEVVAGMGYVLDNLNFFLVKTGGGGNEIFRYEMFIPMCDDQAFLGEVLHRINAAKEANSKVSRVKAWGLASHGLAEDGDGEGGDGEERKQDLFDSIVMLSPDDDRGLWRGVSVLTLSHHSLGKTGYRKFLSQRIVTSEAFGEMRRAAGDTGKTCGNIPSVKTMRWVLGDNPAHVERYCLIGDQSPLGVARFASNVAGSMDSAIAGSNKAANCLRSFMFFRHLSGGLDLRGVPAPEDRGPDPSALLGEVVEEALHSSTNHAVLNEMMSMTLGGAASPGEAKSWLGERFGDLLPGGGPAPPEWWDCEINKGLTLATSIVRPHSPRQMRERFDERMPALAQMFPEDDPRWEGVAAMVLLGRQANFAAWREGEEFGTQLLGSVRARIPGLTKRTLFSIIRDMCSVTVRLLISEKRGAWFGEHAQAARVAGRMPDMFYSSGQAAFWFSVGYGASKLQA